MNDKDTFIANTQRLLSLIFLVGFFAIIILRGIGWLEGEFDLSEALMLILTFWFLRARGNPASDQPSPGGNNAPPNQPNPPNQPT